jgi:transcription-repair coupling factor (superfamily II helicase)
LLEAIKLKQLLTRLRVRKLNLSGERAVIAFAESSEISPQRIVGLVQENSDRFQFTPSFELILSIGKGGWQESFGKTKNILEELVQFSKSQGTQSGPLALEGT